MGLLEHGFQEKNVNGGKRENYGKIWNVGDRGEN